MGKPFKLRSGNTPIFKLLGSSPFNTADVDPYMAEAGVDPKALMSSPVNKTHWTGLTDDERKQKYTTDVPMYIHGEYVEAGSKVKEKKRLFRPKQTKIKIKKREKWGRDYYGKIDKDKTKIIINPEDGTQMVHTKDKEVRPGHVNILSKLTGGRWMDKDTRGSKTPIKPRLQSQHGGFIIDK